MYPIVKKFLRTVYFVVLVAQAGTHSVISLQLVDPFVQSCVGFSSIVGIATISITMPIAVMMKGSLVMGDIS